MPKLVKDVELVKILVKYYKFSLISRKGSHLKLRSPEGRMVIVPIHNQTLRIGTFKAILEEAGISKEDFILHL